MTTPQWAPAEVLQLDLDCLGSTCIGHAKTQGRRCRNPIAYANRQEAAKISIEMSSLDPQSPRLESELEELASRLLCRRWHQDQADEISRKWQRQIRNYQAVQAARRAERPRTIEMPLTPARSTVPRGRVASTRSGSVMSSVTTSVATSVTRQSSTITTVTIFIREESGGRDNTEANEEGAARPQMNAAPDCSSQQQASSQETSNHQPSNPTPTLAADEPTTHTPSTSLQQHPTETREEAQPAAAQAEPSSPASIPPSQAQQPQHEDTHPAHHYHRRTIEGECPICCEDFTTGDDTTWCRAQCRQNFHAGCMDLWHAAQEADEVVKTCPCW